jgi:hypothetical protein
LSNNFRRANYGLLLISKQCVTKEIWKNIKLKGKKQVKVSTTKQKIIWMRGNVGGKKKGKSGRNSPFTVTEQVVQNIHRSFIPKASNAFKSFLPYSKHIALVAFMSFLTCSKLHAFGCHSYIS